MKDTEKNLIAEIKGGDSSARENAILNLMYRMEESTRHITKNDVIDDGHLSQDEQIELIDALIALAESYQQAYSSLLWIIGKANPIIMIDPVQNFVLRHANTMPSEMLYQSLVAVENCMVTKDFIDYEAIKEKFKYDELKTKLGGIITKDNRLGSILKDTLSSMEAFYTQ